jgi:hypothetical protein
MEILEPWIFVSLLSLFVTSIAEVKRKKNSTLSYYGVDPTPLTYFLLHVIAWIVVIPDNIRYLLKGK